MVQKFLFDNQFDAPPPAPPEPVVEEALPAEPELPPEPTYSQAELAEARTTAFSAGRAEGVKEGRLEALAGQGHIQNQLLESVSLRLGDLLSESSERYAQQQSLTLQIALTIASKLMPDYISRHGQGEIEALVRGIMAELSQEPRLVIRVPDQLLDAVQQQIEGEATRRGFNGKMVFLGEPTLGLSDCRIEWADGGAERDTARLWGEIDRLTAQVRQTMPVTPSQNQNAVPPMQSTTQIES